MVHAAGLVNSRGEGRRMVASGGVYVGVRSESSEEIDFRAVSSPETVVDEYILNDKLVLRLGKWKVKVVEIVG